MSDKIVYANTKYNIIACPEPTEEGIGYYNLVNRETTVIEGRVSVLPDAIRFAEEMCAELIKIDNSKATVTTITGNRH